jgi:hypothetical protein
MMAALIAETQTYPVFMSCRTVVIGAHHACWLLLPALFITASVPTVTSTTATRTMSQPSYDPYRASPYGQQNPYGGDDQ